MAPKSPDALIRAEIRQLSAYHVAPAGGMVKLDAMENPYALPHPVQAELAAALSQAPLNRYPDASAASLKATLRATMAIDAELEILLGNGSDEIIQMIALAVARPGAALLALEPSFVMFKTVATLCALRYVGVPLHSDFSLDLPATLTAIAEHEPAVVFIAYPNNPTGNLFHANEIEAVIQAASGLVVIDEAYFPFNDATFLGRLKTYSNLVVMRTLSKLGLAGIRLGFLVGRRQWLMQFDKLRMPYNINVMTQLVANTVLARQDILRAQANAIRAQRSRLLERLSACAGVSAFSSQANFVLFRVSPAEQVFDGLCQRGIFIKDLSRTHPLLRDCLRVTVGTPDENERFLSALHAAIASI